jgi:hypothetical protein
LTDIAAFKDVFFQQTDDEYTDGNTLENIWIGVMTYRKEIFNYRFLRTTRRLTRLLGFRMGFLVRTADDPASPPPSAPGDIASA